MSAYLVPTSRLPKSLLEYLALGPRTTDELCAHFGYSVSAIRYRMNGLEDAGLAHHFKIPYTDTRGSYFIWYAGARTADMTPPAPLAYPANKAPMVIRRHPMDEAFFGPAAAPKQSAPVCTTCRMEQGTGHVAGCRTAMVSA